jgi:integrase
MARHRENLLRIIPLAGGSWLLDGFHLGKRIRKQGRDVNALRVKMQEMQAVLTQATENIMAPRMTRLTEAQLRDAEAAVERAGGRSLLSCVIASDRVMVKGDPVALNFALKDWLAHQAERGRQKDTMENNLGRSRAFIAWLADQGITTVGAVTPEHYESFVYRGKRADFTRKNDASVLQAWANHWKKRRWVKEIPFEVDTKDLSSRARSVDLPRILTPGQAHALLAAAKARGGARLAAYVALACWCFARHAEVLRVSTDDLKLDGKIPVVEIRPRKRGTVSYRAVTVPACVLQVLRDAKAEAVAAHEAEKLPPGPVVSWGRVRWGAVREVAGLAERGAIANKKRPVHSAIWQENILRHTGLSYFFQKSGDITETCRQAGNSSSTAFAHYLNLPVEGASEAFFGA